MAHDHDRCPVCVLYGRLAKVAGLMEDGAAHAGPNGALPVGTGGTIAQARGEVDEALALLGAVAHSTPGQGAAELGQQLHVLRRELEGWVTPAAWVVVPRRAQLVRHWAYRIAGAHFARGWT